MGNTTRGYDNLSAEWLGHNVINYTPWGDNRTAHADLEYGSGGIYWIQNITKVLELLGWE